MGNNQYTKCNGIYLKLNSFVSCTANINCQKPLYYKIPSSKIKLYQKYVTFLSLKIYLES